MPLLVRNIRDFRQVVRSSNFAHQMCQQGGGGGWGWWGGGGGGGRGFVSQNFPSTLPGLISVTRCVIAFKFSPRDLPCIENLKALQLFP